MATKNVTVATIKEMKQKGEPIVMITAYDVAMARNVNEAGVEMILDFGGRLRGQCYAGL